MYLRGAQLDFISFFVAPRLAEANRNIPSAGYKAKTLQNLWNRQHTIITMMIMTAAAMIMIMTLSVFSLQQNVTSLTFE
jgi:hypothetical protein